MSWQVEMKKKVLVDWIHLFLVSKSKKNNIDVKVIFQ